VSEYVIFLRGLAQQRRSPPKWNLAQR